MHYSGKNICPQDVLKIDQYCHTGHSHFLSLKLPFSHYLSFYRSNYILIFLSSLFQLFPFFVCFLPSLFTIIIRPSQRNVSYFYSSPLRSNPSTYKYSFTHTLGPHHSVTPNYKKDTGPTEQFLLNSHPFCSK